MTTTLAEAVEEVAIWNRGFRQTMVVLFRSSSRRWRRTGS